MTRDQKIGLALGILLIGAVAAFFYRHEPVTTAKLPELKSVRELDQEISRRPHAPYLAPQPDPSTPDVRSNDDAEEPGGLVPEPIAMGEGAGSTTRLTSTTTPVSPAESTPRPERFHTVRRGDSLSSIAAEHLGSAARFEELYEANRDLLRNPNDLRIGQQLRIPVSSRINGPPSEAAQPNQPPADAGAGSAATEEAKPMFVPHRGPGIPTRTGPTATAPAGKRLSQVPPDDAIIRR
jgi:LysM repeat protein